MTECTPAIVDPRPRPAGPIDSIFLAESVRERLGEPPEDVVFVAERGVRGRRGPVCVRAVEARAPVPAAHPPGDLLIL